MDVLRKTARAFHKIPVFIQGIALTDVMVGFQGQEVNILFDDALRFCQHLGFADPESSSGYCNSKIIDFNAIELLDAHFDRIHKGTHHSLAMIFGTDYLVLQASQ